MTRPCKTLPALLLAALLGACGGGGIGSGGTGIEVGVADGSISGFGSVVVDGRAYAADSDLGGIEARPGEITPRAARFGETARIEFQTAAGGDRAASVRLDAMAIGPATGIDTAAGRFVVMGQTVLVVGDAAVGPVTFFDGVGGLAALAAGTPVEVHARPRWNATAARYELLATRISVLTALPGLLRAGGVVEAAAGGSFRLGGVEVRYPGGGVLPAGAVPRNGDRVLVWADTVPAGGVLAAQSVRVIPAATASGDAVRLGGSVSRFDGTAKRFELAGRGVRYGSAVVTPNEASGQFVLGDGQPVQVDGVLGADGVIDASHVRLRRRGAAGVLEAELTGEVAGFTGLSGFTVRGTPVDASPPTVLRACTGLALGDGRRVRVEGRVEARAGGSVIRATLLQCQP